MVSVRVRVSIGDCASRIQKLKVLFELFKLVQM